jgi:hypothetical protein
VKEKVGIATTALEELASKSSKSALRTPSTVPVYYLIATPKPAQTSRVTTASDTGFAPKELRI